MWEPFPSLRLIPTVGRLVGEAEMVHFLCLLFGHQKTRVPLSSNRYTCRRCGFDFGVEVQMAVPAPTGPLRPPQTGKHGAARRLHR
jgi:hypothetical protein